VTAVTAELGCHGEPSLAAAVAWARGAIEKSAALADEALHIRQFAVGGLVIKARFSNPILAANYEHRLAATPANSLGPPSLRLDVLESTALDWPAPLPPSGHALPQFDIAMRDAGLRALRQHDSQVWQVFEPASGRGLQLAHKLESLPSWDGGAPLRVFLHWALAARGARLCHGATLGRDGHGILLAGAAGSGKSATILAGLACGLSTTGDDYVRLDLDPIPAARALFRNCKQDPAGLDRLALFHRPGPLTWHGKVEMNIETLFPGALAHKLDLSAILLPRIAKAPQTSFTEVAGGEAVRVLFPSNFSQMASDGGETLRFLSELARRLPAWRVELSTDPREIGAAMAKFLEKCAP
jgi:hypothetical protein